MYLQKNLSLFMEEDDDVNGTLNKILINDSFSWTLLKFTQSYAHRVGVSTPTRVSLQ